MRTESSQVWKRDRRLENRCVCSRSGDAQVPHESAVATDQIGIALSYHYTNASLAHQLQKYPANPRHIYHGRPRHYTAAHGSDAGGFALRCPVLGGTTATALERGPLPDCARQGDRYAVSGKGNFRDSAVTRLTDRKHRGARIAEKDQRSR